MKAIAHSHVYLLDSRARDGFIADNDWIDSLKRQRMLCRICGGVRPDAPAILDVAYVNNKPREDAFGRIAKLGIGVALNVRLIELIGERLLRHLCHFVTIKNVDGYIHKNHYLLIEKLPKAIFRGTKKSRIGICRECGRLLYWPVPWNEWYLLRQYWNNDCDVTFLDQEIVCTPAFYNSILKTQKLPLLTYRRIRIAEVAEDGLPEGLEELVHSIRQNGWIR